MDMQLFIIIMNRSQYVSLNDTISECMKVTCGVPQGSILGPALFIVYINDNVKCVIVDEIDCTCR